MKFPIIVVLICIGSYLLFLAKPQLPKTQDEVKREEAKNLFSKSMSIAISKNLVEGFDTSVYMPFAHTAQKSPDYQLKYAACVAMLVEANKKPTGRLVDSIMMVSEKK